MPTSIRRRCATGFTIALVAVPCARTELLRAQSGRDLRFDALVTLTESKIKEYGVPGVALGIIDGGALTTRGLGITNVVMRTTARADELTPEELVAGGRALVRKVRRRKPRFLALLGVTAYRIAFNERKAAVGLQIRTIGDSKVWVLPNPSGLNAHYQLPALAEAFAELRLAARE